MKKFAVWYTTFGASPTRVITDAESYEDALAKVKGWLQPRYAASFEGRAEPWGWRDYSKADGQ